MNVAAWLLSGLLAAVFFSSGVAKSVMSKERMIETGQTGVKPFPLPVIRVVAGSEVLGAVGLVLPWAIDVLPWLTPLAVAGLCLVMIGAAISHWSLAERPQVGANAVILVMLVFIGLVRIGQLG